MDFFSKVISIALIAIFVQNTILFRGLGTSTMLLAAKNKKQLLGIGLFVTYFSVTGSGITFFLQYLFWNESAEYYLKPLFFIIVLGSIYIITQLIIWLIVPKIFMKIKKFIHLATFNCAVLGTLLVNSMENETFIEYILFGLFNGIGFLIASYLLMVVYDKLNSEKIPLAFRGFPIILIYIGIISMSLFGLTK